MSNPYQYPALIYRDKAGFWLEFIDLKTCVAQGDTIEELYDNAREALSLYLEDFAEIGIMPEPSRMKYPNVAYISPLPEIVIPLTLLQFRLSVNLTRDEMAKLIGISREAYLKLENVKEFNPTVRTLRKVSRALGKKLNITMS